MKKKLTVGFLFDGPLAKRWQIELIDQLSSEPESFRTLAFVLVAEHEPSVLKSGDRPNGLLSKLTTSVNEFVFATANSVDRALADRLDARLAEVDAVQQVSDRFPSAEAFPVGLLSTWGEPDIAGREDDLKWLSLFGLDVLLCFGPSVLRKAVRKIPRLGVWSLTSGCDVSYDGAPPGFWEFYNNLPITSVILGCVDDEGRIGTVVARGHYQTINYSWNLNRRHSRELGKYLIVDALRKAARDGAADCSQALDDHPAALPVAKAPAVWHSIWAVVRMGSRLGKKILGWKWFPVVWELRLTRSDPLNVDTRNAVAVRAPRGRFWADPFVIGWKGRCYIFFEDFFFREGAGKISVVAIDPDTLSAGPAQVVLETGYHLSYPYLFERNGKLFMVPESFQSKSIELFECMQFPNKWMKVGNILEDISAADTSIFEADGRWWLFTNVSRSGRLANYCVEMHIYWSNDPIAGPWIPHKENPVLRDARVARNAGGVIRHPQLGLLRISQINGTHYAEGVNINRIRMLTPEEYSEEVLVTMRPHGQQGYTSFHHISSSSGLTVFDLGRPRLTFGVRE